MSFYTLPTSGLEALFETLKARAYQLIGPRVQDAAIVYREVDHPSDLAVSYQDEQEAGYYRLKQTNEQHVFGHSLGPQSWKAYLFPPKLRLWRAERDEEEGFKVLAETPDTPRYAFIGVRPCELRAIEVQDQVFLAGDYQDPVYKARREQAFIVAVNCTRAGETCFCSSLGTGPNATSGFDLALTEVYQPEEHYFVLEVGSEAGQAVLEALPHREASAAEIAQAEREIQHAAEQMHRTVNPEGTRELLYQNTEHPFWDSVAERCLSCANCTMVCPTCFCHSVDDVTDLTGQQAERVRHWDSCFTGDFSYIHGGSVRASVKSRYRQWLSHKFASWLDQFGSLGCVGCGRCITWCPVGIDITEGLATLREGAERVHT